VPHNVTRFFSGSVFEPIDEFKGDIARALPYFATRYEVNFNDSGWDSHTATNDPIAANRFTSRVHKPFTGLLTLTQQVKKEIDW
jgi:hypothetical protein